MSDVLALCDYSAKFDDLSEESDNAVDSGIGNLKNSVMLGGPYLTRNE